jgi:hypothetical protein
LNAGASRVTVVAWPPENPDALPWAARLHGPFLLAPPRNAPSALVILDLAVEHAGGARNTLGFVFHVDGEAEASLHSVFGTNVLIAPMRPGAPTAWEGDPG